MATVHLLAGLPCSGKTTYAKSLAAKTNAVHFCLDYWLISLFGRYAIETIGHEEHVRRVVACRNLIWESAAEILKRKGDIILDDGFFLRANRMSCVTRAKESGAAAHIHFLDVPNEVIAARLRARNAALPDFNFLIEPSLVDQFKKLFEVPSDKEGAALTRVSS
jgi:predicted kinase